MPERVRPLLVQLARFSVVGGVGFVVDAGLFTALRAADPIGVHGWPMYAKAISVVAAIAVNWVGNRTWTFRAEGRRSDTAREAVEFLVASLLGSLVALACLGFSHYALHLTSALADNVSANMVGLLLGSAVRFVAYRRWVFAERRPLGAAIAVAIE
ncbi:GtrA family protein [Agromyces sp. ISL-38]|uniref:GtrA family protein n=1 Tax=Agromyces sp. ISL-38 TaxID=2819107 RepID=UPI001BEC34B3|nr:GtrA family protein [Agromyces sp. ISL-38]MBT2500186.1 GtrA family protein [Agromyces sp. ISL-38]